MYHNTLRSPGSPNPPQTNPQIFEAPNLHENQSSGFLSDHEKHYKSDTYGQLV